MRSPFDVGSLNGTYLNRERVEDGELVAGDELQIGKFKLVFFAGQSTGRRRVGSCGIRSSATCRPGQAAAENTAGSASPAKPTGASGTMSIGEVLGILKPEFDITVSKIRFLEDAGWSSPTSASGYRKFSEDDVARLRFVLRAQRDQYLPLRVIRQRLADLEQVGGLEEEVPAGPGRAGPGGDAVGDQGGSGTGTTAGRLGRGPGWPEPDGQMPERGAGASGAEVAGAGSAGAGASGAGAAGPAAGSPGSGAPGTGSAGTAAPGAGAQGSPGVGAAVAAAGQPARGTVEGSRPRPVDAQFTATSSAARPAPTWTSSWSWSRSELVSARGALSAAPGTEATTWSCSGWPASSPTTAWSSPPPHVQAVRRARGRPVRASGRPLVRQRNPEAARARDPSRPWPSSAAACATGPPLSRPAWPTPATLLLIGC